MNEVQYPGKDGTSFKLVLKNNWFKKGDILNEYYKVIEVYDKIWWRRFLIWIGILNKTNTIKVEKL